MGAERLVYALLNDERVIIRIDENQASPTIGSTIYASPRADKVHHFDVSTGKRMRLHSREGGNPCDWIPAFAGMTVLYVDIIMQTVNSENWPYPRWIAHRGAGKLAPENTLAAFKLGASHGYRMFECDVKLSSDGVPFLLHDSTLERTTSGKGMAGEQTWDAALTTRCWQLAFA